MLSDEEEAIEWLKRLVKINKRDNLDNTFAEILLNLIKKQSKEIEELKEDNKNLEDELNKYIVKMSDEQYRRLVDIIRDETSKEWVDKIKAKIEEYEKALNILLQKNEWIEPSDTIIRNKFIHYIEFGQSLLEKE